MFCSSKVGVGKIARGKGSGCRAPSRRKPTYWDLEAEAPELGEFLQIFSKNKEFLSIF